jgi:alkaline phosphatase D
MNVLTRRDLLKVTGAAALAGCGVSNLTDAPDPALEEDAAPDETFDASDLKFPEDAGEAPRDAAATEDASAPLDASRDVDASRGVDASRDASRDAPTDARRDVGTPTPDVRRDAGPPAPDPEFQDLPERAGQFPLGVMAGDAADTSLIFWTKYEGTAPLVLRVLEMDGGRVSAMRFDGRVTPSSAGVVRAVVTGLRPNRLHRYAFLVAPGGTPNGRSLIGRARTAIADDSREPIVFAGTACTNQNHRPFPALVHAGSRTDLDFFIHAGDHVYTDHGSPSESLAEYRAKYADNWSSAGLRSLHRSTGMYLTWDDHEVRNNWDPENFPPARLAAARQAFFEHRATRRNTSAPDRIWRSFRWGRTAEVFILDCRSERRPSTRSNTAARESVYISRAQMDWLKSGLRTSPATFKFIVNSVPIYERPGGTGSDNWLGYPSQRREILNHIENQNIRGVVWLSGDIHVGGVVSVHAGSRDAWEVIMGPGGADRRELPDVNRDRWPVYVGDRHNYAVIRADPSDRTLTVEFIDGTGSRIPGSLWTRRVA